MSIFVNISFHEFNVSPVKPIPERQPPIACVESEKKNGAIFGSVFFCLILYLIITSNGGSHETLVKRLEESDIQNGHS